MNRSILAATFLLLAPLCADAQSFTLATSPRIQTLPSSKMASYTVSVSSQNGFGASVFLTARTPSLPGAKLTVSPDFLNAPYDKSATVTIEFPVWPSAGTHQVIIEGKNGPLVIDDTASLVVPEQNPWGAWRNFNQYNSPFSPSKPWAFALDRKQGVGWFQRGDSLLRFDGSNWTGYAWPRSTDDHPIRGIALDSNGTVWSLFEGFTTYLPSFIVARTAQGQWRLYDAADSSSGLTIGMLNSLHWTIGTTTKIQAGVDGDIWINGEDRLIHFDGTRWSDYTSTNSQYIEAEHYNFFIDRKGSVWLRNWFEPPHFLRFDGTFWTRYPDKEFGIPYGQLIVPSAVDRDNNVWIPFAQQDGNLKFDGSTFTRYGSDAGWLSKKISDFDRNNHPWVISDGIARTDGTTWWHYTPSNSGLPSGNVSQVRVDDSMTVWIITDQGLTLLDGSLPPQDALTSGVPDPGTPTPSVYRLEAWPNPVAATSTIHLSAPRREHVRLSISNGLGQEVALLLDETVEPGEQIVSFNSGELPAGTYFLRLLTSTGSRVEPIVIVP